MEPDPVTQIGPYRIVDTLGEGGMGVVYLAEQSEPVRRQVALKILKAEVGSEQVLARFEAERQTLAVMDHPSIAKVYDAGVTEDGRPYFVMEVVRGVPLSEYCDERRLTVRERAKLFVDVCGAVQHAHQKGVVHRDLKPSNILVSDVHGRALARVIDFGIAKAVEPEDFDGTRLTRDDEVIGTPAYMSPEQIDGSADVDTRTDIYALGVLLYEMITGALPYEPGAYRGWAAIAAQLSREPPSPSRRFADLADTQETISSLRSTTPKQLRKDLSGDLGWIVSRAMEKDRNRRYETVNAMALDLERYLTHEPIRARGASTLYVAGKFVRRNRLAVAFGVTVVLGLIGFSVATSVQSARVTRARDEAEARRGQAEGLIDFMLSDLRDKLEPIGRLDVLDDVGAQATEYFSSIPADQFSDDELASRSQALYQIGSVRLDQGDSRSAVDAFAESLRLASALSERAPDDPERLFGLSQSHFYVGYASWLAGDLDSAEGEFLAYLDAAQRLVAMDPESLDYLMEVGFAYGNIGAIQEARGSLDGAVESYSRTLEVLQTVVASDSTNIGWLGELAETHNKLGFVFRKMGDYDGALREHTAELEGKERILEIDPTHAYWRFRWALAMGFIADVREVTGEWEESLPLRDRQIEVLDSMVSYDSTNTSWRRNLGIVRLKRAQTLRYLGRVAEAREGVDRAEREISRLVAADSSGFGWNVDLASVLTQRSTLLLVGGRSELGLEAADTAVTLLDQAEASTAGWAAASAKAHLARGSAMDQLGRTEEAAREWEQVLTVIEPFVDGGDPNEFRPLRARALLLLGRQEAARPDLDALRASGYVNPDLGLLR